MSAQSQPVSDIQFQQLKVEWVTRDKVKPNKYNPNRMTLTDRMLLRQSVLEDGWTQPIVTLMDGTIVDGEQRWTVSGMPISSKDVKAIIRKMKEQAKQQGIKPSASILSRLEASLEKITQLEEDRGEGNVLMVDLTNGFIPITRVDFRDDAHKMISTIRHNRARGTHRIDSMAEITQDLQQLGLDMDDLEVRLGMSKEEVDRLTDTRSLTEQLNGVIEGFSEAWEPTLLTEIAEEDDLVARAIHRSAGVQQEAKQYAKAQADRQKQINTAAQERIKQAEGHGLSLTQDEKEKIREEVADEIPEPEKPERAKLRKITLFFTPEEHDLFMDIVGDEPAANVMRLIQKAIEEGWAAA